VASKNRQKGKQKGVYVCGGFGKMQNKRGAGKNEGSERVKGLANSINQRTV